MMFGGKNIYPCHLSFPLTFIETKQARDLCVVEKGESGCVKEIEAHKLCLREEGFDMK